MCRWGVCEASRLVAREALWRGGQRPGDPGQEGCSRERDSKGLGSRKGLEEGGVFHLGRVSRRGTLEGRGVRGVSPSRLPGHPGRGGVQRSASRASRSPFLAAFSLL